MYGLVNQAIKDLVCSHFGEEKWVEILQKCRSQTADARDFEPMQSYPDKMTYDVVAAATQVLGLSAEEILQRFGDHWITYTAEQGYGEIMSLFGRDLRTCLQNLNGMHGHMGTMMPHLQPPRFQLTENSADRMTLHYFSTREGLAPMVMGLLEGLARKYGNTLQISHFAKGSRSSHDEFDIVVVS